MWSLFTTFKYLRLSISCWFLYLEESQRVHHLKHWENKNQDQNNRLRCVNRGNKNKWVMFIFLSYWFPFLSFFFKSSRNLKNEIHFHCFFIKRPFKDTACCFEQILEATSHKTATVWTFTSYLSKHPRKASNTYRTLLVK